LPSAAQSVSSLEAERRARSSPGRCGRSIDTPPAGWLALGLAGKRAAYYRSLSGGQRQRLSVALALIGQPKIAVELIEGVRDRGVTIILVTHFMEEAERLCDRVALIDNGRVAALDSPARLAAQVRGGKSVRFRPSAPFDDRLLTELPEVARVERDGQHVVVTGTGELINAVILTLAGTGVTAHDVQLDSSNLEDAFVRLTGNHKAGATT
jgi:ABC-2 type transport system ATP-binding protein